ncbi:pancreatic lipase-related protein 3-like isoform X2, partial [Leptotrombidium deliense]
IFWVHDPEGLNPNHANLVEAIHTNSAPLGYGYRGQEGHYDYFPNGGDHQPGCVTLEVILSLVFHFQLKAFVKHGYKPKTIDLKLIGKNRNETVSLIRFVSNVNENNYFSLLTIAETKELNKTPGPFESAVVLDYFVDNNRAVNVIEKLEINYMSNIKESCVSSRLSGEAPGFCYDNRIFWCRDPAELNSNQATLVEAFHTNKPSLGFGYRGQEGEYDYFPNGGDHQLVAS